MSSPTLADRMKIAFEGLRAGEGALTCGQTNTWQWMRTDVSNPMATLQWKLPLPADTPVADVVEAFAILLARHESLRTTFHEHDGEMRQRVLRSGVLAAEIHQVDASADTELTSQRMIDQLRQKPFDLVNELPVRLAIALVEDKALAAVTVYSHMAVDYGSMAILGREFAELIGTVGNRSVGAARHQPLDQAAEEASPRGRRRTAAALRYWTQHLRQIPQCLMALPPVGDGDGPASAALRSSSATAALDRIAARTQASPAAAVLAAFSAVVSVRVGQSRCVFASLSSNRFTSRLRDYVGTLAQDGLVVVDVTGPTFDDLVRRTSAAMLRANRSSIFDVTELVTQAVQINDEQGMDFSRDCVFNNISAHLPSGTDETTNVQLPPLDPPDLRWSPTAGAAEHSTLTWMPAPPFPNRLVLQLIAAQPALVVGLSTGDTRHVPQPEIAGLLRGMEGVLVAAGAGPLHLADVPDLTGLIPVPRDSNWVRVGVSWVQLSEVQTLLREALGTPAYATAEPDGDGHRLTAHLLASDGVRTPRQAHTACMAHLGGRYAVAAPHHYVLHDSAPTDLTDLAAWRSRPVLARGDGRASTEDHR
ncbi:condensation domain-containing protein [Verrucosispora sp. WMMA2044]|uniref:condensation domain-containing protein n=1 Tax=Verrucosispora sp. WMMA2044 TaxID=3016419 RepID=UPI00248AC6C7|nr:condensation domain-containing protein [Verrucosispora sp. WMMA2044]WBB50258.1 condensation domain-containing protein [Verrucosispora sp. WMMA2044]